MLVVRLESVDSTHTYINNVSVPEALVVADYQTAGQGMGSNTWESEAGRNILFSLRKDVRWMSVKDRFLLSMAGALALKRVLDKYTSGISLKWPNDIYWQDRKISGTLIATTIAGRNLRDCVYSVGLNVNQAQFHSDAPNPVSLLQITGAENNREQLLQEIISAFNQLLGVLKEGGAEEIRHEYLASLYRREGFWPFEDANGRFEARIIGIACFGYLQLEDRDGQKREYEIKQIKHIIFNNN